MKRLILSLVTITAFVSIAAETRAEKLAVVRKIAAEGIVLLKNEDAVLPLDPGEEVALLGVTSYHCHRMGWGSGDMMQHLPVQYAQGLEQAGIALYKPMVDFFGKEPENYRHLNKVWWKWTSRFTEPLRGVTEPEFAALCPARPGMKCIVTIGRNSGESVDSTPGPGGWKLHWEEDYLLKLACANFDQVIVLLNVYGPIDTSWLEQYPIKGLLLTSMLGEVSGLAVADVLTGKVNPSGKLTATWARRYRDYPTTDCFAAMEVPFNEGIYVGYRYFDTFQIKPRFPFGFGLSYTSFAVEPSRELSFRDGKAVSAFAKVANTGKRSGREIVQCYVSAAAGTIEKPYQVLVGSRDITLTPGESGEVEITFDLAQLAVWDEQNACWVLEKGDYVVRVGNSSRDTTVAGVFTIDQTVVVERAVTRLAPPKNDLALISPKNPPRPLEESAVIAAKRQQCPTSGIVTGDRTASYPKAQKLAKRGFVSWSDVKAGKRTVEDFVAQLDDQELASIVNGAIFDEIGTAVEGGTGVGGNYSGSVSCEAAETWSSPKYGLPPMTCADGPSGVRLGNFGDPESKYNPQCAEMIQWPSATVIAQSWSTANARKIGELTRADMEKSGIHGWLAPGLNIQRNPLCGRNFEYFSEDPLVAGRMAAAVCRGVQEHVVDGRVGYSGRHVTIKHFAVNSQEFERASENNVVSERALREIYLKPFEIAVKEGSPKAVMSSYNRINGEFAATSYDLLTGILRGEWGFDGMVMTDWWNMADNARHQAAGNDLIMPGVKAKRELIARGLAEGTIDRTEVQRAAVRIVELVRQTVK